MLLNVYSMLIIVIMSFLPMNVASDPTVGFECDPTDCVAVCGMPATHDCTNILCTENGKDVIRSCTEYRTSDNPKPIQVGIRF